MIILDDKPFEVPGVPTTISWMDDPKRVLRTRKTNPRTRQLRSIVCHTVHGRRSKMLEPDGKPSDQDFIWARSQVNGTRAASWDFTVDTDGSVVWQNDPVRAFTWHAMQVNPFSLGFEMVTDEDGTMYQATVDAACRMIAFLCEQLGIQKQTAWDEIGNRPEAGRITRMDPGKAGVDCVGVFGHRNVWIPRSKTDPTLVPARGFGDPNDYVFVELVNTHGFERFSFNARPGEVPEDLRTWKERQATLGFEGRDLDGLPLRNTVKRLEAAGYRHGLWADGKAVG